MFPFVCERKILNRAEGSGKRQGRIQKKRTEKGQVEARRRKEWRTERKSWMGKAGWKEDLAKDGIRREGDKRRTDDED